MTHFGILCPAMTGHINSVTPLGRELQQRGHRVTFFQFSDARTRVLEAGLEFTAIAPDIYPVGSAAAFQCELAKLSGLAGLRCTVERFRQELEVTLQEAPPLLRAAGVEALIIDQVMLEGKTIADLLDLPFITFCSALPLNHDPDVPPLMLNWSYDPTPWGRVRNRLGYALEAQAIGPILQSVQRFRQERGLPRYSGSGLGFSPLAQICQLVAEFDYPRTTLPPCFHFTGPHHSTQTRRPIAFPFEQLSGLPLVYASMGTLQNGQEWIFQAIAAACDGLPVQLVISLGNPAATLPTNLPGAPLVVPYAPQIELLQRATLTITHAGLNTTLESLNQGVPMVAIPITNDQPGVAARIARSGVGEMLPLKQVTTSRLRRAIDRVLIGPSYQEQTHRLQAAIHRSGGVRQAADIVETAVATRQLARI